jgi:hypothetical protein
MTDVDNGSYDFEELAGAVDAAPTGQSSYLIASERGCDGAAPIHELDVG